MYWYLRHIVIKQRKYEALISVGYGNHGQRKNNGCPSDCGSFWPASGRGKFRRKCISTPFLPGHETLGFSFTDLFSDGKIASADGDRQYADKSAGKFQA